MSYWWMKPCQELPKHSGDFMCYTIIDSELFKGPRFMEMSWSPEIGWNWPGETDFKVVYWSYLPRPEDNLKGQ